uniref:G2 and S phase-expressed protein 1 N-terminal domain-containing protein n=1 Tax=Anser cygnoides TaxID=8845 RepID=A0A8B9EHV7_ANSCY
WPSPRSREEEEEDEEPPGGAAGGRWSPLSGARLEEMVREATRLAAQLQQCRLPPLAPGPQGGGGSPRSPRRETFVVKDSPVRALLPTVPPARQVGGGAAGVGGHTCGVMGARGAGCTPPPIPLPTISLLPGHPRLSPPAGTQGTPTRGQGDPWPGRPPPAVPPAWGRGCGTGQVRAPPERDGR